LSLAVQESGDKIARDEIARKSKKKAQIIEKEKKAPEVQKTDP